MRSEFVTNCDFSAPRLIAIGLMTLLLAAVFPSVPIVSAIALIALGATIATISRVGATAFLAPALATHLFVYMGLYLLSVGAVWHAATAGTLRGLTVVQAGDLVLSAAVMLLVVRLSLATLIRPRA